MCEVNTVTLTNGENVRLEIDSVCNQKQTFVRMGKRLIVGVVDDPTLQGIYIWREVNGVYQYLGDTFFKEQEDSSVIWSTYTRTHGTPQFEKRAAEFLAKQGEAHASGISTGNHIKLLSIAAGVSV